MGFILLFPFIKTFKIFIFIFLIKQRRIKRFMKIFPSKFQQQRKYYFFHFYCYEISKFLFYCKEEGLVKKDIVLIRQWSQGGLGPKSLRGNKF
jgi:hypothetical protein